MANDAAPEEVPAPEVLERAQEIERIMLVRAIEALSKATGRSAEEVVAILSSNLDESYDAAVQEQSTSKGPRLYLPE